jgi:hypothetical protein
MATNLSRVMTRDQAVNEFEMFVLPTVIEHYEQDGIIDGPARREAWNNWTDGLCKDNQISDWQYENWSQPTSCSRPRRY